MTKTDKIFGQSKTDRRKRIALLVPSSNTMMENDLHSALPREQSKPPDRYCGPKIAQHTRWLGQSAECLCRPTGYEASERARAGKFWACIVPGRERLRKDDDAPDHLGAGNAHAGSAFGNRRSQRSRRAGVAARLHHGLPELRAVPPYVGCRECRLRPAPSKGRQRGGDEADADRAGDGPP